MNSVEDLGRLLRTRSAVCYKRFMNTPPAPYYHYCSADTFYKIIQNKSIWLSSVTASNDRFEGKWLSTVVERVAREHGVLDWDRFLLVNMIKRMEEEIDCLGFCMSSDGDMLSQWRGYAEDGIGFSIGFSRNFVGSTFGQSPFAPHVQLQQVVYDHGPQGQAVAAFLPRIKQLISEGAFRQPVPGTLLGGLKPQAEVEDEKRLYEQKNNELLLSLRGMMELVYSFKNPAFREEKEVRLAALVMKPHVGLDFSLRRGRLVPFLDESFKHWPGQVIQEVILGPKNRNDVPTVESFLARHELFGIKVTTSEASYR